MFKCITFLLQHPSVHRLLMEQGYMICGPSGSLVYQVGDQVAL